MGARGLLVHVRRANVSMALSALKKRHHLLGIGHHLLLDPANDRRELRVVLDLDAGGVNGVWIEEIFNLLIVYLEITRPEEEFSIGILLHEREGIIDSERDYAWLFGCTIHREGLSRRSLPVTENRTVVA